MSFQALHKSAKVEQQIFSCGGGGGVQIPFRREPYLYVFSATVKWSDVDLVGQSRPSLNDELENLINEIT